VPQHLRGVQKKSPI